MILAVDCASYSIGQGCGFGGIFWFLFGIINLILFAVCRYRLAQAIKRIKELQEEREGGQD